MIYSILAPLIILGLIMFVHEYGHYLVAVWSRMKVEEFSIGFGPALWTRHTPTLEYEPLWSGDIKDGPALLRRLRDGEDRPANAVRARLDTTLVARMAEVTDERLEASEDKDADLKALLADIVAGLRHLCEEAPLTDPAFESYEVAEEEMDFRRRNRLLLESIFADEIAPAQGTTYSLRALPFFAYVRIAGMGFEDEDHPKGFNSKRLGPRALCLLAGSAANITLALALFCLGGVVFGNMVGVTSVIESVVPGGPADRAGLQAGDRIVQVLEKRTTDVATIKEMIESRPGRLVKLTVERAGSERSFSLTPEAHQETYWDDDAQKEVTHTIGRIGIAFTPRMERVGPVAAVRQGVARTYYTTVNTLYGIYLLFSGKVKGGFIGPVGMMRETAGRARLGKAGLPNLVRWTAFISLNIGLLNLFPFPALDGGRMVFILLEVARRGRRVNTEKEKIVHAYGMLFLLLLISVVTVKELHQAIAQYVRQWIH